MNLFLIAIGSHGDVHPFVGLGQALRDRGHRVTLMANAYFEPLVTRAGLDFLGIGTPEEYERTALNPDLWHPIKGFKVVAQFGMLRCVRPVYDAVVQFHKSHPPGEAVVVGSSLAFGARMAQEKFAVPFASVHLSPAVFQSAYDTPKYPGVYLPEWAPRWWKRGFFGLMDAMAIHPTVGKPLNAMRAELGLPPARRIFREWLHSPQLVIGLFPDWFAAPQPDWPANTHLIGFPLYDERDVEPLPADLARFLDDGEPPVAFTPGSAMWQGRSFLEASAEACRLLGRRGVLLTRYRDHLPASLPPGVIHVPYAPFSQLLPRCAAVVHHGGVGSCAQGLAAAVPQLVMPMAHDQYDNANRLARLGVSRSVPTRHYRGPRVAAELKTLLDDPDVPRNCRAAAERFRGTDPLGDACDLIERMGREGHPAASATAGAT